MRKPFALLLLIVASAAVFAQSKELNNQGLTLLDDDLAIEFFGGRNDDINLPRTSQTNASSRPSFPYFSQLDPRWSDEVMGISTMTIGSSGCELTSLAMLLAGFNVTVIGESVNPSTLNKYLKQEYGWIMRSEIRWPVLWSLGIQAVGPFKAFEEIAKNIAGGNYCILTIDIHWVLAVGISEGNYVVMDPRDQSKKTYNKYEVKEARCFVKKK